MPEPHASLPRRPRAPARRPRVPHVRLRPRSLRPGRLVREPGPRARARSAGEHCGSGGVVDMTQVVLKISMLSCLVPSLLLGLAAERVAPILGTVSLIALIVFG